MRPCKVVQSGGGVGGGSTSPRNSQSGSPWYLVCPALGSQGRRSCKTHLVDWSTMEICDSGPQGPLGAWWLTQAPAG
jgi:hypothetical protein